MTTVNCLLGWCMDGNHAPNGNGDGCPGVMPPKSVGAGRDRRETPEMSCTCWCHKRDALLGSINPTTRKRKRA